MRKKCKAKAEAQKFHLFKTTHHEDSVSTTAATTWCGQETKDSMIYSILTNRHPPDRYRVNQVLANQPEFAAAFHCDVGSPMNPKERCAVW
ncbi:hypothetical protein Y032_0034g2902 [Ancylostoma ceylanicum]|uniref:Peptidase M13 C-terminal domain-containing protein n=1 Tax=Ancylostoma ceylanicum TaxID=53326 RepID=A0A016UP69_9BILA|nr:hypothetical protein Y032_0034g2902 [Ancylostoma ceylanicum]